MQTIKHIGVDGKEALITVGKVDYDPVKREVVGYEDDTTSPRPEVKVRLTSGRIFVMNPMGSTVAAYNLNVKPLGNVEGAEP